MSQCGVRFSASTGAVLCRAVLHFRGEAWAANIAVLYCPCQEVDVLPPKHAVLAARACALMPKAQGDVLVAGFINRLSICRGSFTLAKGAVVAGRHAGRVVDALAAERLASCAVVNCNS